MKLSISPFVKSIAIVADGTIGAHAITMAFSPLVTRIYGPEAFGILGKFSSILAFLMPIAGLSLRLAIVIADNATEADAIKSISACAALFLPVLVFVILLPSAEFFASALSI